MKTTKSAVLGLLAIAVLLITPKLNAQTFNLTDGLVLSYNTTGDTIVNVTGDNGSIGNAQSSTVNGEGGGAYGVINLTTSGSNAARFYTSCYQGRGWLAIEPLTPAQRASNATLYTQETQKGTKESEWGTYNQKTGAVTNVVYVPQGQTVSGKTMIAQNLVVASDTPVGSLTGNQTTVVGWFHNGYPEGSPDSAFKKITTVNSSYSAVVWDGAQLHLTDGTTDTIVPTPVGWAGDVAFVNMSEQDPNTSDGWQDQIVFMGATIGGLQPQGTITPTNSRLLPSQQGTVSWGVTNGG